MSERKALVIFLTILLQICLFNVFIPSAIAKGSSIGKDVWWEKNAPVEQGGGIWKAKIYKNEAGIVHEWRYEWNGESVDVHLIYKPVEYFPNQPRGKNWISWIFDDRYIDLPGDEADLTDFFTRYSSYWVHFNREIY